MRIWKQLDQILECTSFIEKISSPGVCWPNLVQRIENGILERAGWIIISAPQILKRIGRALQYCRVTSNLVDNIDAKLRTKRPDSSVAGVSAWLQ